MTIIPDYINQLIEKYQPLPSEEQLELAKKAKAGDGDARELLVNSNLRFILQEIRALPTIPVRLEFSDLFNAGVQGMLEALERFEIENANNFLTYAYWWIKKRVIQTVYSNLSVIHIPKAQVKQLERLYALCERRIQRHQADSEDSSDTGMYGAIGMAQELFGDTDKAAFLRLHAAWRAFDVVDFDPDTDQHTPPPDDGPPGDSILCEEIERYMAMLNEREEDIVKRYFGLGCNPQSYEEIGILYILTPERIRQILQSAMQKIREGAPPAVDNSGEGRHPTTSSSSTEEGAVP